MALTDDEKARRKARAKRRREAKSAGTWVAPGDRKTKKRKDLSKRISAEVHVRTKEETEQILKRRRKTETKRLGVRFKVGEPVLIKAQIQGHIGAAEAGGIPRYYVEPIISIDRGYDPIKGLPKMKRKAWIMTENFLTSWPKRKKGKR